MPTWKHSLFSVRQTSQLSQRPFSARFEQFDHMDSAQIGSFVSGPRNKRFRGTEKEAAGERPGESILSIQESKRIKTHRFDMISIDFVMWVSLQSFICILFSGMVSLRELMNIAPRHHMPFSHVN